MTTSKTLSKISQALTIAFTAAVLLSGCDGDDDAVTTAPPVVEEPVVDQPIVRVLPDFLPYNAQFPALPEGIAYDPQRNGFFVSSASSGTIALITEDGSYAPVVAPETFLGNGTFGLSIDTNNNRLLAVSASFSDPTVAQLYIFDLATFTVLHQIDLGSLSATGANFANDVTVDEQGNAYVTNSYQGIIYKVDIDGNSEILFNNVEYAAVDPSQNSGFNGIAWHPDNILVIAHSQNNALYKLDLDNELALTQIDVPQGTVYEPDGIVIEGDKLVVVNAGKIAGFVSQFTLSDDVSTAQLTGETSATGSVFPTTVASADGGFYTNISYFNFPAYGNSPVDYLISRANFGGLQAAAGEAHQIPRFNTPVIPLGYGGELPEPLLSGCTDAIAATVPDLTGSWIETTVTINGELLPHNEQAPHQERIEQCAQRILIASNGVIHDVFKADGTMYNGVNDVNPLGLPIHSTAQFSDNGLILTPVLPVSEDMEIPPVTRELISTDDGIDALKYFHPDLGTLYLTKQ